MPRGGKRATSVAADSAGEDAPLTTVPGRYRTRASKKDNNAANSPLQSLPAPTRKPSGRKASVTREQKEKKTTAKSTAKGTANNSAAISEKEGEYAPIPESAPVAIQEHEHEHEQKPASEQTREPAPESEPVPKLSAVSAIQSTQSIDEDIAESAHNPESTVLATVESAPEPVPEPILAHVAEPLADTSIPFPKPVDERPGSPIQVPAHSPERASRSATSRSPSVTEQSNITSRISLSPSLSPTRQLSITVGNPSMLAISTPRRPNTNSPFQTPSNGQVAAAQMSSNKRGRDPEDANEERSTKRARGEFNTSISRQPGLAPSSNGSNQSNVAVPRSAKKLYLTPKSKRPMRSKLGSQSVGGKLLSSIPEDIAEREKLFKTSFGVQMPKQSENPAVDDEPQETVAGIELEPFSNVKNFFDDQRRETNLDQDKQMDGATRTSAGTINPSNSTPSMRTPSTRKASFLKPTPIPRTSYARTPARKFPPGSTFAIPPKFSDSLLGELEPLLTRPDLLVASLALIKYGVQHPRRAIPEGQEMTDALKRFSRTHRNGVSKSNHRQPSSARRAKNSTKENTTEPMAGNAESDASDDEAMKGNTGDVNPTPQQPDTSVPELRQSRIWNGVSSLTSILATPFKSPMKFFGGHRTEPAAQASADGTIMMPSPSIRSPNFSPATTISTSSPSTPTPAIPGAFKSRTKRPQTERKSRAPVSRVDQDSDNEPQVKRRRTGTGYDSGKVPVHLGHIISEERKAELQALQIEREEREERELREAVEENKARLRQQALDNGVDPSEIPELHPDYLVPQPGQKRKGMHNSPTPVASNTFRVPDYSDSDSDSESEEENQTGSPFKVVEKNTTERSFFTDRAAPTDRVRPYDGDLFRNPRLGRTTDPVFVPQKNIFGSTPPPPSPSVETKKDEVAKPAAESSVLQEKTWQQTPPPPPKTPRPVNAQLPQQPPQTVQKYLPAKPSRLREVEIMSPVQLDEENVDPENFDPTVLAAVNALPTENLLTWKLPKEMKCQSLAHKNNIEECLDPANFDQAVLEVVNAFPADDLLDWQLPNWMQCRMAVGLDNEADKAAAKSLGMKSIYQGSKAGEDSSENED